MLSTAIGWLSKIGQVAVNSRDMYLDFIENSLRGPALPGHQLAVYWYSWYKVFPCLLLWAIFGYWQDIFEQLLRKKFNIKNLTQSMFNYIRIPFK